MKSKKVGIPSLNEALQKLGFTDTIEDAFSNWTVALFVNDCTLGNKYCYLNSNLNDLKIVPKVSILPFTGSSKLSITRLTKNWAGNWEKFIGGRGVLKLEFSGIKGLNFKIPYIVQDTEGKYQVSMLTLNKDQKGEVFISKFGTDKKALIVLPSLETKTVGFNGEEPTFPYSLSISIVERTPEEEQKYIEDLLGQIELLKAEIVKLQAQIIAAKAAKENTCAGFYSDLFFGMKSNADVKCLQIVLERNGVYSARLFTGNFGELTKEAVILFQEKYASEILIPAGLKKGTGYVGPLTRKKLNEVL